jgi:hypothetical protein
MKEVGLDELLEIIQRVPTMVDIHPISAEFLPDEVERIENPWQIVALLDNPLPQEPKMMLSTRIESSLTLRLPVFRCRHDPWTPALNRILLKRYDRIRKKMLCQSHFPDYIFQKVSSDVIAVLLIDGLSYRDIQAYAPQYLPFTKPVLVDGVSITTHGMKRLIGERPLVYRLYEKSYSDSRGFSYWDKEDNELTNHLFHGFGTRYYKIKSFNEVITALNQIPLRRAYIQILRMGLDGLAHRFRDKPPISAQIGEILADLQSLVNFFIGKGYLFEVYLTGDHGILWANEHQWKYLCDDHTTHVAPRYWDYYKEKPHTLNVTFEGREYALLEYPYLRRPLYKNEWGVHGGLSFEESIVPLIEISTNRMPATLI